MEICRNIKIRILAFMMAFWLAFSVSYNDYQEVKALEWAVPVIGFDTALKFLLGLLGVSITSKALHDNVDWNEVQEDCMNYQIQKGNDAVAVGEWWEDVAKGTLNQASECWSAFKEWVKTKINTPTGSFGEINNPVNVVNFVSNYLGYDGVCTFAGAPVDCYFYCIEISNSGTVDMHCFSFPDTPSYSIDSHYLISSVTPLHRYYYTSFSPTDTTIGLSVQEFNFAQNKFNFNDSRSRYIFISPFAFTVTNWNLNGTYETFNEIGDTTTQPDVDKPFETVNPNIENTDLADKDTTTGAIPGALPLPWDLVGDDAPAIDDTISQAQEAVAEGEMDMADYWQMVLDLLDVLAIDDTADPPVSMPDNTPVPDIVADNVGNGEFTLKGLEKVFPFCIPWDIKDFVTLLVARPVAPVINYPFYNPATKQNVNIVIDFSQWETVVIIFRYILDFLLIIGLLLLARQLAGAGGDD